MADNKPFKEPSGKSLSFDQARTDLARHVIYPKGAGGANDNDQALIEMSDVPRQSVVLEAIVKTQEETAEWLALPEPRPPFSIMNTFLRWVAILSRGQGRSLIEETIKIAGTSSDALKNSLGALGGGLGGDITSRSF